MWLVRDVFAFWAISVDQGCGDPGREVADRKGVGRMVGDRTFFFGQFLLGLLGWDGLEEGIDSFRHWELGKDRNQIYLSYIYNHLRVDA